MASTKEKIFQVVENNQSKLMNGALVIGGIYLTYRLGKNIIASLNKSDAQNKADDSPEVRQAMALRSAMNPSGISWMMSFDTTNSGTVIDTAKTINNLDSVQKAYKNLYQNNLLDDLQSELSTSAVAIVPRRVDIAAVMVIQPCCADRGKVQASHGREQAKYYPCGKG